MQITPGNLDDRVPVPDLLQSLFGKVFAARDYISKSLAQKNLSDFGIEFFARPRRNMKNCLMRLTDKLLSRNRLIIETIIDQLKNISQIEHSHQPELTLSSKGCGLLFKQALRGVKDWRKIHLPSLMGKG